MASSAQEKDQFIEHSSCDGGLKSEFNKDLLSAFWLIERERRIWIYFRQSFEIVDFFQ